MNLIRLAAFRMAQAFGPSTLSLYSFGGDLRINVAFEPVHLFLLYAIGKSCAENFVGVVNRTKPLANQV
jgi:hypothetical protein